MPLRAKDGGVLRRPGHTEAAVDLAVLAGLRPSGTLCEVVSEKDPHGMARGEELRVFADEHDLCAALRESLCRRAPDAGSGAGDEDGFLLGTHGRCRPP